MKEEVKVKTETASPEKKGRKKKEENPQEVWKWYGYKNVFFYFVNERIHKVIFMKNFKHFFFHLNQNPNLCVQVGRSETSRRYKMAIFGA